MTRILAVAAAALIAGWNAADALTPSAVLLAAAAFAVAGLVILAARRLAASAGPDAPAGSVSLRERTGRTFFIRSRDPGAAGRPRPRAPSAPARAAHA